MKLEPEEDSPLVKDCKDFIIENDLSPEQIEKYKATIVAAVETGARVGARTVMELQIKEIEDNAEQPRGAKH